MKRAVVDHLVLYLSSACNLSCAYCYARSSGGVSAITPRRLVRAISAFSTLSGSGKKVTFLGGEPLLHPELLRRGVLAARRLLPAGTPIHLFTNGTLLNKDVRAFLSENSVKVVISLDGGKKANDEERKFKHDKRSVFDSVAKNIKRPGDMSASIVVTPGSADSLAQNIRTIRGLGFKSIAWAPDVTCDWSDTDVQVLRRSLLKVELDYLRDLKAGKEIYEIANAYEIWTRTLTGERVSPCSNLVLAPDGFFYPCDKILSEPARARRFRLGSGMSLDIAKRKKFFSLAGKHGAGSSQIMCPAGSWAYAGIVRGIKGASLSRRLAGHARLRELVSDWYESFMARAAAYPAFREMHGSGISE